jgi:hypothetical protein
LFHLSAEDPEALLGALTDKGPPESAGQEEAIRRLFTPAVMTAANQYPEYAIQSRPGFLVVSRGSGVLPSRQRTELRDAAVDLRALLTRPAERGAKAVIPGRVAMDRSRQARKVGNAVVSGVLGLFVGFILAMMVMSIAFFRQVPGQGPGLGFSLLPVLVPVFVLVGAAVGAGIGWRVPVQNLTPGQAEDPAQRRRRQRAAECGALVGLFGGFIGGFVVFVASKTLFGWKLDDFGAEGALFFGSIFGSALIWAVTCATVVNRLYRRRRVRNHSSHAPLDESGRGEN